MTAADPPDEAHAPAATATPEQSPYRTAGVPAASPPLLEVDKIDVFYDDVQVLYGLRFEVRRGEIVTLLGSNGAGKTTTLRAITGLRPPRAGEIRFAGRRLTAVPPAARAELGIALVPEGRELWPQLTVLENLELGAYTRRARPNAQQTLERMFALFPRLKERRRQAAGSLSGGEQQMCAIARALMSEPQLLMLDELSLGLAPVLVDQLMQTIAELHAGGMTILLVEQNLRKALAIAQRGVIIETGRLRLEGPSAELAANPEIRAAYLGL
jgi:branched-chain amino acid transport system ATP-binding protein